MRCENHGGVIWCEWDVVYVVVLDNLLHDHIMQCQIHGVLYGVIGMSYT